MLLIEVVDASADVAAVSGRKAKIARLAELLAGAGREAVPLVAGFLTGELRQGKVGVGFAAIRDLDAPPASEPSLTVADVDAMADDLAGISGAGSKARRAELLESVYRRASEREQVFLSRLLLGEMRQGALDGVMVEAVASAAGVPAAAVRRAHMLRGSLAAVAETAVTDGEQGLAGYGLEVFRPLQPMLAKTADSLEEAVSGFGTAAVEWKLDGARLQIHKAGDEVQMFTRTLKEVTGRSPEVVEAVRAFPAESLVLDAEVIALRADGSPYPFQVTMGRFGRQTSGGEIPLIPLVFDVLHVDGKDTIDLPASSRFEVLARAVPESFRVPRLVTGDPEAAQQFMDGALDIGHEGVMVKSLDATYAAGRRGAGWLKVKPAHTLDLVVLAAEWGHGRRTGWLSNLHLGARDPQSGEFVMLGKTFKGLTDATLDWQTRELLAREIGREGQTVHVRPELVVEVAFNELQRSRQYPAGMALRFARVKGYRQDKSALDADTIATVAAIYRARTQGPAA
jgi:ATP-dependent DNA ligase I